MRKKGLIVKAALVCVCVLMTAEFGWCGNYKGMGNKSPEAVRSGMQNMEIHIADKAYTVKASYTVKAAKTAEELRTGLMNVRNLSDNAGMLFDLRQYPGASMWMKIHIFLWICFLSAAIGKWLIFMRMRNLSPFAESAVQSRFAMFWKSTAEMPRLRELQRAMGLCPTVRYEIMFY